MANKPKSQGTARETALVNHAVDNLRLAAQRSPNNAPSRDVDIEVGYSTLRVEVKDRQRLSVHQTVDDMVEANGDEHPSALFWHRYEKKPGNTRRTSMGSVWVVPEHVMEAMLLALEHHAPDWWVPA